jgi:hypothetical protein
MGISESMASGKLRTITASQRMQANTLSQLVAGLVGDIETTKATYDRMAYKPIGAIDLARYFAEVLNIDVSQLNQVYPDGRPVISTKSKNMLTSLAAAYDSAPGSKWAHGTVWGALNAVTYYATHAKTCRATNGATAASARYASNLDGDSAALKARALSLASNLVAVAA